MHKSVKLYVISLILLFTNSVFGQFYFIEDEIDQIELNFLRKKIEIEPDESFFNVLKISNPTNTKLTFETNFSYPGNWTFMGEKTQQITLNPKDSILIPFRGAPSKQAMGEIGYTIVASLTSLKGTKIKNEYSFVNIPKESNLKYRPKSRVVYFDRNKNQTEIELDFTNKGNVDEIMYVNIKLPENLTMEGAIDGGYKDEFTLKSSTDTTIILPVKISKKRNNRYEKNFHRLQVNVQSKDTSIYTSIWAKELKNSYTNEIPTNYKMLSVEFLTQNLFSESPAYSNIRLSGNILPKSDRSFFFDIQSYGVSSRDIDLWRQSRLIFRYTDKIFKLELGDLSKIMGHVLNGRGGYLETKIRKYNIIKTSLTQTKKTSINRAALSYSRIFNNNSIELGGSYEDDPNIFKESYIGFSGIQFSTKKFGNFNLNTAYSNSLWKNSQENINGFGARLIYNYNKKDLVVHLNGRYGDRNFAGYNAGRGTLYGYLTYYLNNESAININGSYTITSPINYTNAADNPININASSNIRALYNRNLTPRTQFSIGPQFESKEGNNFFGITDAYLKTRSIYAYSSFMLRNPYNQGNFVTTIKAGVDIPVAARMEGPQFATLKNKWFSSVITFAYRAKIWGLSSAYYHGPYSINQQYAYFSTGYYSKFLRLMPYLNIFIVPKFLQFVTRPTYFYDIPGKSSRLNATNDLVVFPGRDWEIALSNTMSYSSTKDQISGDKDTYSTAFFEFRIKKAFNFNQPRYQYHNLKVIFFKDLNGNRVQDKDEPGIKDVLVQFELAEGDLNNDNMGSGFFMNMELLSDLDGIAKYENIPNGFYNISYRPIGKLEGAFTSETNNMEVYIEKDKTLYIPFVENNKIFGKVILNRSKLSNLGTIDPANIKVTAEDSRGKKYSTLTDAAGNFTIFVPNVDIYKVRINNIYYENFELEQNDYEVQLNGYRQFEVNFIFNEKRRKIRFNTSYEYGATKDAPGIEIIRRTNLNGTVKDATTLKPLVATIRVIDGDGNEVTSAKSNLNNGLFATSFVAGDDYTLEVSADDYWFYAEKLYSQQIVTFKNLKKDVLLRGITVGSLIPMRTLKFESGSAEIPLIAFPELERLLKVLKQNPGVKISVHGHADDMEIQGSDVDLALERAKLIAKYLIANGYNRVKYVGHSNTKPIADNDTETGRKENRRVEIVVTGK